MSREVELTALGGGAHRITMPLPWALDHVHCYALEGSEGWTLIDAGLGTPGTIRRWGEALAALGDPLIERVVITHYHPDHVGGSMMGWEIEGAAELAAIDGVEARLHCHRDEARGIKQVTGLSDSDLVLHDGEIGRAHV